MWTTPAFAEDLGNGLVLRQSDGVAYVSGGIGDGQQDALNRVSNRFNLKVTMAMKDGKYIGHADVRIVDGQGREILDTAAEGPMLFAKLPPGTYHVEATLAGQSLGQDVNVPAEGQKHVMLTWPLSADDSLKTSRR
jgi:hypothetical protein